jgi:hypothetical protein
MDQTFKGGIAAAAAGLLALSGPASAEFYVGGGIGDGTIESSENTPAGSFNFDESDFAWKIFGGYMFSEYLGVELAYLDMGSPSQNFGFDGGESGPVQVDFNAELTGFTVHGVLAYPFGPFEVFGKLGVISYDAQLEAKSSDVDARIKADDDGEELAYGVGAKYNIDNFALRAEWDIYDTGDVDDVSMWTIGAELSF